LAICDAVEARLVHFAGWDPEDFPSAEDAPVVLDTILAETTQDGST